MDEKQFIEALREANGPMRALVLSVTQSPADLDDILQETSRALWEKIDEYDPAQPFLPWALSFSRLQSMAWMKKKGREDRKLRSFALESIEEAILREAEGTSHRDMAHLNFCVSKLTDRQRDLLHRRYHLGYTIPEIATLEGKSSSREALYKTFQRLHQALLTCLERQRNQDTA
ncbi:MAG: sigma-70 family RNA polymerase sigma factor [Verrucomicrobiota bacterium]